MPDLFLLQNYIYLNHIITENDNPINPVKFTPVLDINGSEKRTHITNNL